jgi:two-component system, chemotaxis family, chemotaxis protein CheY
MLYISIQNPRIESEIILNNPLRNYQIMIVDADIELAKVLKEMLREMGFHNVRTTRSGKEAIEQMQTEPFDFVITEWNTQHIDGMELLKYLRRNPNSPNPALPVIMLTGRAEQTDVFMARDYGINEYVVKPFTARSIYSRLERLIEQPRNFVVSEDFIGPDRRLRGTPPEGVAERRTPRPAGKVQPARISIGAVLKDGEPHIWLPNFALKMKLGKDLHLKDFVTPEVLEQSQKAIDAITGTSMHWIKDNLQELKEYLEMVTRGDYPPTIGREIADSALAINSRAGTFGYGRASEIAYALYLFARNSFDPSNPAQHIVLQKHIEVLYVILGNQMRGTAGAVGAQIATELKALIQKYS